MGSRGPVPKREDQRIRRNKDEGGPVEKISAIGGVAVPDLGIPDCHPMVQDFYDSLPESAQTQFYEASDWQVARFVCFHMDKQLKNSRPSSQMLAAIHSMLTELLVTEGSRRRVRMEIEREQAAGQLLDAASLFRERQAQ